MAQTQEAKVIGLAGDLWNAIIELEALPEYDESILNEYIHRIQDMMYTKLFIKEIGML